METTKYVRSKVASEKLGVSLVTLREWDKQGKIETIRTGGNQRLYNIEKYLNEQKKESLDDNKSKKSNESEDEERLRICYIRVSTVGQKDDLERQRKYMKTNYPKHEIIEDIGSGINFNRRGLRKIIKLGIKGKIKEVVIAHKDRLTRFGYELIEDIIKDYSKGEIIIDDKKAKLKDPKEELVEDVLQILNVFTAKINGLRKYGKL